MAILLNQVSVDTVSPDPFIGAGGPVVVSIRANSYGGGTVTLSTSPSSDILNRFSGLNNGVFTEDDDVQIDYLPAGTQLIATLAGSTGASNVFVEAV